MSPRQDSVPEWKVTSLALALALAPLPSGALTRTDVLEEVLVTAQKREQPLASVPLSVQSFTADTLESLNLRDIADIVTFVPGASEGLSISMGQRQYQLRGISTNNQGDPTTGYYIDDAAFFIYGEPYAPVGRAFDLDRVEVLRGPQSTLYGNGSMGGTIRFITNRPEMNRVTALARAGYAETDGGDSSYYVDGVASLPLVQDLLALRLVGSYEKVGGYADGVMGEQDTNEGKLTDLRGTLLWQPGQNTEATFLYVRNVADQDGSATLASLDPAIETGRAGDYTDRDYDLYSVTLSTDTALGNLTSTTTWIDHQTDALYNIPFAIAPDGTLRSTFDTDGDALNNETRLVSASDAPLKWLVGVFYSDTKTSQTTATNIPDLVPESVQDLESESISLFAEISQEFLNGSVVPLLGLRYFDDDRQSDITTSEEPVGERNFDSINPRFNLSLLPATDQLYYLNIAKGFRSGNFNNPNVCTLHSLPVEEGGGGLPCRDAVDSDELWSYEIGARWKLADYGLALDLAAYYQDWQDMRQVVQFNGLFQDYQVGDGEVYGLDFSLGWAPLSIQGLRLQASANVNSAEFTDLNAAIQSASGMREGDRIPLVPEWTLGLSGAYAWSLGQGWQGEVSAGYSHLDKQYGQFGTTEAGDRRDLLRARIGADNEQFGLWLFGSNLLDEDGAIYLQNPSAGLSFATQDYPRQVGIQASYRY